MGKPGETGTASILTVEVRSGMIRCVPRTARVVAVAAPHHVTQRGNNRQQVFFSNAQRRYYLALLAAHAQEHALRILGYCLMPNHVHAIVLPEFKDSMAKGLGRAHNAYSRYLNRLRRRSGHLWQNRFFSAPMERQHVFRALRYVDLNPVRAGIVERATEYAWSSARAHAGEPDLSGLIDRELWEELVPLGDWGDVLAEPASADEQWRKRFRAATYAGKPLGSKEFISELEKQAQASLALRGPGRPRKKPMAVVAAAGLLAS